MMVTHVRGHFKDVHGTLDFDPKDPMALPSKSSLMRAKSGLARRRATLTCGAQTSSTWKFFPRSLSASPACGTPILECVSMTKLT
jgi:hypothetical protein